MMAKVAPDSNLIKDFGDWQNLIGLGFRKLAGDAQGSSQ
jgi:hypothetical protein